MWNPFKRNLIEKARTIEKGDIPDTEAAIRFAMRENHKNDMACFREEATMFPLPREAANGTCGQGTIETTYKELKAVFGQPTGGSADGKVRKSWCFHIDGIVCTIYDWKTGRTALSRIRHWSVGGSSPLSIKLIRLAILEYRIKEGWPHVGGCRAPCP
ncbi:hypothetical protein CMK18_21520 [Candidatus Poribacteria bacterium]|nr:hypothetical protein [Candidatus Poribacteria bacterium]